MLRAALILSLALSSPASPAPPADEPRAPHVVIMLDGIPFAGAEEAFRDGCFPGFQAPGRLVSCFPSLTTPSISEVLEPLGIGPPRGYELRFVDLEAHEARGGGLFDYDDFPSPWKAGFQLAEESLAFKTLAYFSPRLASRYEVSELAERLEELTAPLFLAYVGATDALVHTGGPRAAASFMEDLGETLSAVQERRQARGLPALRILVLSDHGCQFSPPGYRTMHSVDLEDALEALGYEVGERIGPSRVLVYPLFGLVGASALYAADSLGPVERRDLARRLGAVDGIDLVLLREAPGVIRVLGHSGDALVHHAAGRDAYRYEPVEGDPLELRAVVESLASSGELAADGFAADRAWFAATALHRYPDALYRVVKAFDRSLVQNPATMLISYADDHYSSRPLVGAGLIVTMKDFDGTHGNLGAPSTYGLVLSNAAAPEPAIRGAQVLRRFLPASLVEETAAARRAARKKAP